MKRFQVWHDSDGYGDWSQDGDVDTWEEAVAIWEDVSGWASQKPIITEHIPVKIVDGREVRFLDTEVNHAG